MWKAELTEIKKEGGNLLPTVVFTDDVTNETITEIARANDLTPARLAEFCQRKIEALEARDAAFLTLTIGKITLPRDSVDPDVIVAIEKKTAADDFFAKLALLNTLNRQVAKGLLAADDASIVTATLNVKSAFLPEYALDPRFG